MILANQGGSILGRVLLVSFVGLISPGAERAGHGFVGTELEGAAS
ncbi:hypothetical protein [Streptomyces sp. NPDC002402]